MKYLRDVITESSCPQKRASIGWIPACGRFLITAMEAALPRSCSVAGMTGRIISIIFIIFVVSSFAHARQAILSSLMGTVEIQAGGSSFWRKAVPKIFLKEGDKIRTGARSRATLLFEDGSRTQVSANTTLALSNLAAPVSLNQTAGKTRHKIAKLGRGFTLRTPTAVCSVRGTEFEVGVGEGGNTDLNVFDGIVNGLKTATGESLDVGAGQSLKFDDSQDPLAAPSPTEGKAEESAVKELAKKEVGLDMTREAIQAAAAEEMKLAEYQEGKALIDVNGNRVRLQEYILRKPKDVTEADRDKAFKFVVLNSREGRLDYFTYKGIFNKTLPDDLSIALKNASGKVFGDEPEFYLRSYEMAQSNITDAVKDMADGGHLVKVTFNGTTYTLEAYSVAADGKAGTTTDPAVLQNSSAGGKTYDPVADVYLNSGVVLREARDGSTGEFRNMNAGDTLWRTTFNRYAHLLGPSGVLASLTLDNVPAGTLTQPWFQYYTTRAGITNIATLESINNAALNSDPSIPTLTVGNKTLDTLPDQNIGSASFRYLNGRYASNSVSDAINLHDNIVIYYPKSSSDIPYEQYDTYIISDEGKMAPRTSFAGLRTGTLGFNQELVKWNYEQVVRSSSFNGRSIDFVAEPRILLRSGLLPGPEPSK